MKQGWKIKRLGDICCPKKEIKRASTYCSSSDRIAYIDISSIDAASNRIVVPNEMIFKDAPSRAQQMVKCHDVLVSLVRPNLKNIAMVHTGTDYLVASSGFCVLRAKENPYYIKYLVTSEKFTKYLMSRTSGANYPAVREDDIRSFQVCVPPIAEQEKIVAELDCLSGIIEKKKQQLKELDNLAQSIFYEMFGDPVENDKGWETKKVIDVVKLQRGYDLPIQHRQSDGGIPVWGSNGIVGWHNEAKVDYGVITGRSGTLGTVYSYDKPFFPLNTTLFSVDTHGNDIVYLKYLLNIFDLKRFGTGTGVPTLNRNVFHSEPIISVPLTLQQDFASKIESIEKQKELIAKSIKETETLFNSRMDYYFN